VAALCTLAIFSYLYRDNPFYKAAEYLFVGVASGFYLSIQFDNVLVPNLFRPVAQGSLVRVLALALGFLMFARFLPRAGWLSRWPIGVMVGAYSGLAVIGFAQGDLIEQVRSNVVPIVAPGAVASFREARGVVDTVAAGLGLLTNAVLIVGVLSALYYFFFSSEHRGVGGRVARLGIYFLMISFGASYGATVMGRISLALERLHFLYGTWLGFPL
jgi:hypothetical protein